MRLFRNWKWLNCKNEFSKGIQQCRNAEYIQLYLILPNMIPRLPSTISNNSKTWKRLQANTSWRQKMYQTYTEKTCSSKLYTFLYDWKINCEGNGQYVSKNLNQFLEMHHVESDMFDGSLMWWRDFNIS